MAEIKIEVERTFLQRIKNPMQRVLDRAILRSLNRTISSVRTMVQREITEKTGVKKKDIMPRLFIHRAERSNQAAALKSLGRGVPLVLFGARRVRIQSDRGKRFGVSAMVKGQRQVIAGGFLAEMPNGKVGVFARKDVTRSRKGKPRSSPELPIKQLFSSEVQDLIRSDTGFLSRVKRYGHDTFEKNFAADYKFFADREGLRAT